MAFEEQAATPLQKNFSWNQPTFPRRVLPRNLNCDLLTEPILCRVEIIFFAPLPREPSYRWLLVAVPACQLMTVAHPINLEDNQVSSSAPAQPGRFPSCRVQLARLHCDRGSDQQS